MIYLYCSRCGARLPLPDTALGQHSKCSNCGAVFNVSAPEIGRTDRSAPWLHDPVPVRPEPKREGTDNAVGDLYAPVQNPLFPLSSPWF